MLFFFALHFLRLTKVRRKKERVEKFNAKNGWYFIVCESFRYTQNAWGRLCEWMRDREKRNRRKRGKEKYWRTRLSWDGVMWWFDCDFKLLPKPSLLPSKCFYIVFIFHFELTFVSLHFRFVCSLILYFIPPSLSLALSLNITFIGTECERKHIDGIKLLLRY